MAGILIMEVERQRLAKENYKLRLENEELRKDLAQCEDSLVRVEEERNRYLHELEEARLVIEKFNVTLERREELIRLEERKNGDQSSFLLESVREENRRLEELSKGLTRQLSAKQALIQQARTLLAECSRKYKFPMPRFDAAEQFESSVDHEGRLVNLTEKYNQVCANYDNLMAENKILRRLSGVPDNYGFDLEQVKLAEKEETIDYRRKIRLLENDVQELEKERSQLRYKLKHLGGKKGSSDRYKELNEEELQILDEVAIDIKTGSFHKGKHSGRAGIGASSTLAREQEE
jgi:hypothetical protein